MSENSATIMVIDDAPSAIYLMRRIVERCGCRMVSAGLGERALDLARRERPALVVLDLMLPGMSGWEVLRALKADRATRHIPVLLCSVMNEEARGREEGADGFLHKPVDCRDLAAALENVGVDRQAAGHRADVAGERRCAGKSR